MRNTDVNLEERVLINGHDDPEDMLFGGFYDDEIPRGITYSLPPVFKNGLPEERKEIGGLRGR